MRKSIAGLLLASSLALTACSQQASEDTSQTSSGKKPTISQTASTSTAEAKSSSSTQAKTQEKKADYSAVLDGYRNTKSYGDLTFYGDYTQYATYDIDGNGTEELLMAAGDSSAPYVGVIGYMADGQPELLDEAYVASSGGHRSSLQFYPDGSIVLANWESGTGEGQGRLYELTDDGVNLVQETDFSMRNGDDPTALFDLSESPVDVRTLDLDWKPVN